MPSAFIGIGSNIEPEANISQALRMLSHHVRITALSNFYLNPPQGCHGQPPFYNGAAMVETDLPPKTLKLSVLRCIEEDLGRTRSQDRYAPRTIDLDLLLYDDMVKSMDDITLPDPLISERVFLAVPLCELAPDLILPGSGSALKEIAARFIGHGMQPQHEFTNMLRKELLDGL